MKVPEGSIFFNKNKICKDIYLDEIEKFIREKLSEENLRILEGELGLKDRIFMLYWNNRFFTSLGAEEILESVNQCISAYKFLLDSDLNPKQIRNAFMRALMDVISLGSGTYFLIWDSGHDLYKHRTHAGGSKGGKPCFWPRKHKLGRIFRFTFAEISELMEKKYLQIPGAIQWFEGVLPFKLESLGKGRQHSYPLAKQLLISYSYPLFLLHVRKKIDVEKFEQEFFLKHRWCLERLSRCNPIFLNKYREEICREISYDLGLDPDPSYFRGGYFQNNPISLARDTDFLSQITNIIISCFSGEELALFNETTEDEGLAGSLEDQIKDRYYSKYPSFAPIQEIKENIEKKISEYKALLNKETVEVIREVLFDEIERECFVSKTTHLGNIEMRNNLKMGNSKGANKRVRRAVNMLIDLLPVEAVKEFEMEVSGRKCNLQEQLLSRGRNGGFSVGFKSFQDYLSMLHIYTPYSIVNGKGSVSKIDLQSFLEEIDIFFLYPNRGRILKKVFRRLDSGKVIGFFNITRMNMSTYGSDPIISILGIFCCCCLLIVVMILAVTKGS